VGAAPKSKVVDAVSVYGRLSEMQEAGYAADDAVYKAASAAFGNGAKKLYVATKGEDETALDVLGKATGVNGWYGIVDTTGADVSEIAEWAEANKKLFGYTVDSVEEVVEMAYYRTFVCVSANENMHVAIMAKCMSNRAGSETWAYKSLAGMKADEFTSAEIAALKQVNANYYVKCAGRDITLDGKSTKGEWIDVIRFVDWLEAQIQTNIYSAYVSNVKIPYTNAGIAIIENQIKAALNEGQERGGIAADEYDSEGKLVSGYEVSVPNVFDVPAADKANRTLKNVSFTARLAGAIHVVEIVGTVVE